MRLVSLTIITTLILVVSMAPSSSGEELTSVPSPEAEIMVKSPSLRFDQTKLILPLGKTKTLYIKGQPDLNFTVGGYDVKIMEAQVDKEERKVVAKGMAVGETLLLVVNDEGEMGAVRVLVQKPAGIIPESLDIKVTGDPASREILVRSAMAELKRAVILEEGATLVIEEEEILGPDLVEKGSLGALGVPVELCAPQCLPVSGHVIVRIKNVAVEDREDDYLMVSNNPEVIHEQGVLFFGKIKEKESTRLLYYHYVPQGRIFNLVVTLENNTSSPTEAHIISGIGGPDADGIFTGHIATLRFMDSLHSGNGEILDIPPHSTVVLTEQRLLEGKEVATGLLRISLLKGPELILKVKALEEGKDEEDLPYVMGYASDNRSCGLFGEPSVDIYREYRMGDGSLEISLGLEPKILSLGGNLLIGNYGVLHKIHLKLVNDSKDASSHIKLIHVSRGGLNRGIFLIEDTLYETGLLDAQAVKEEEILSFVLPPQTTKDLTILTMPQPGSYYPTRLVVRGEG